MKVERDYLGKRYTFIPASKEDEKFLDVFNKYIDKLEEENKNLKLIQETNEKQIQNDLKERDELREENKNLKEKLSEITMVSDDEKQSIEHILELEEENRKLKRIIGNIVYLYKEEPTELGEYVKSGFKGGMSN